MNKFYGTAEALASYRYVFANPIALARTAGSWILLMAVASYWILHEAHQSDQGGQLRAMLALASLVVVSLTLPLFMLSWQRFMLTGRAQVFGALADLGSDWAFLWRWWVFSFIARSAGDSLSKQGIWLASVVHVPDPAPLRVGATIVAYLCVLVAFGASYGLDLPAIAASGRRMPAAERVAMRREIGGAFSRGLPLAGLPYPAVDLLPSGEGLVGRFGDLQLAALCVVSGVISFAALAVLATYLCRAYLSAKAQLVSNSPADIFD